MFDFANALDKIRENPIREAKREVRRKAGKKIVPTSVPSPQADIWPQIVQTICSVGVYEAVMGAMTSFNVISTAKRSF